MEVRMRPAFPGLLVALTAVHLPLPANAQSSQRPRTTQQTGQVSLTYLGAAGWGITDGTTVILIDPYLSRINGPRPPGAGAAGSPIPGDGRPSYGMDDLAVPDVATIDSHIPRADFILVTHTHYHTVLDVPHIELTTR